jgi:hypothetical protein
MHEKRRQRKFDCGQTGPAFVCSIRDRQIATAMVIYADNDEAESSTKGGAECTVS